jgi:predicted RNA binding protein with dsRBD fold (UPF0201 family)
LGNDFDVSVLIEGTVALSEDPDKVLRAVEGLVGESVHTVEAMKGLVRVSSEGQRCLTLVRDQFRDRHVRSAARRLLLSNRNGNFTKLLLNRQAASLGVAVLCSSEEESSLGPIYMTIQSSRLDSVIDWLTDYGTK